ncbi:hypothetical protein [Candidatus Hecatella orcuttiae]|uniref:hypothetical protein n=1 Tax=Candidatus Hecatella orcuttiae TaxID=1935119 RepID=UPI002867D21F|nr:hypothetical protein [Candidatus Hecatella orcuttiae]
MTFKNYDDASSEILMQCIHRALSDLLGNSGAKAIFYHLDIDEKMVNLNTFTEKLRQIFGIGARILEERIVSTLSHELGVRPPRRDLEFGEKVQKVLDAGLKKKKKRKS